MGAEDPHSIAGKLPAPARRVPLVVVGAGPAGLAAALEAARLGVRVLLVDENPLDWDLMAMDVPLHYGQRMGPAARSRALALARVVESSPGLALADAAGVEVELGVMAWGAFRNGPTVRELPGPVLGLADARRSWLVGYDRLVVAAGARDLALGFAGWDKAGVMGAQAAHALLTRYGALAARRMVVLGSGDLGLRTAALARAHGVEVAAVVEVAPEPRGEAALVEALGRDGVPVLGGHVVREARGPTGEVESVVLVRLDADLRPVAGSETEIACDTVCLAVGLVPAIELPASLGCRLAFRSALGGFVPETDASMRTSLPGVWVAGDGAGVHDGMLADPGVASAQGRRAALAAAESLGAIAPDQARRLAAELPARDGTGRPEVHGHQAAWLRALVASGGLDVHACQCEEVTRRELAAVSPPRYLAWDSAPMRARSLRTLATEGPVSQDQLKRLTRVGMGPCQGRRCREQVALLVAAETGTAVDRIPPPTYRPPVRPLPLSVLWPEDEPAEMRERWVSWFGIPGQFGPHWGPAADTGAPAAALED